MQQAQSVILAQNLLRLASGSKLGRLIAAAVLPFLGVVAAFGIAPDTVVDQPVVTQVIEQVALPDFAAIDNSDQTFWHEERIQRGDTVASLLARLQVADPAAVNTLRSDARGAGAPPVDTGPHHPREDH